MDRGAIDQGLLFDQDLFAPKVELYQFSYLRPQKGAHDYEEWKQLFAMYAVAQHRNGRELNEELAEEARKYADCLHAQLFAMKEGERMAGVMS